jgi:hypothetical protein
VATWCSDPSIQFVVGAMDKQSLLALFSGAAPTPETSPPLSDSTRPTRVLLGVALMFRRCLTKPLISELLMISYPVDPLHGCCE